MAKRKIIQTAKPKKVTLPKIGAGKFTPAAQGIKTVLHIGINSATPQALNASFTSPDWHCVRIDSESIVQPNILTPCYDLSMIPNASVEAIWAPHILHKVHVHQAKAALSEMNRVLKDEGKLYVIVPDAQIACAYIANNRMDETLFTSAAGPVTPHDLLFGFAKGIERGNTQLQHKAAFTSESLGLLARESGLSTITITRARFEIQLMAIKYAFDNPNRVERIAINGSTELKNIPIVPPIPQQAATNAPAGYRTQPNMMFDELNQPPFIWKELGLKK